MTHPQQVYIARSSLLLTLVAILFLATTARHLPVVENLNDKLNHLLAFFVLAMQLDFSFPDQKSTYYPKYIALLLYGILLECIQNFLPHRTFSLADVLADGAGIILYLSCHPLFRKLPLLKRRWH